MTPLHILVAENNEFSARFLERLLTRPGHRVQLATNGRETLTLAEEKGWQRCRRPQGNGPSVKQQVENA